MAKETDLMCGCCGSDEVEIVVDPHVTNFSPTAQPGCLSDAGLAGGSSALILMGGKQLRMCLVALARVIDGMGRVMEGK